MLYFALENPAALGPTGPPALATFAGIFILGMIAYYATKQYYKRNGIDISLAAMQIPPE